MKKNHLDCSHFLKPSCPNFKHKFAMAFLAKETSPGHATTYLTNEDGNNMDSLCTECDSFKSI
jgi:hypothetical protein